MQNTKSRYSVRFLVPTIAAALITTLAVALSMFGSVQRVDADTAERELGLIERATEELVNQLSYAQEYLAVSDDAVTAYATGDHAWLWNYMAHATYETYGHPGAIILDANLKPIIAMQEGDDVVPETFAAEIAKLLPLIARIRSDDGQRRISAYRDGLTTDIPSAIDLMHFNGQPAYVGVIPILPNGDGPGFPTETQPYFVTVVLLDEDMAAYLSDQYLLGDIAFSSAPLPGADWDAMPMRANDGTIITYLNWQPLYPGARLFADTLPTLLIGLGIAAAIIGVLLRNLRLSLARLRKEREDADYRANHDPLTGLGNRRLFQARLTEAFQNVTDESKIALFALDLDRFKHVNDTLGHDAGDALLVQVGRRVTDLLPTGATVARLGGDEFAVMLECGSNDDPSHKARQIVTALGQPFVLSGQSATIGASIGIALAPDHANNPSGLMSRADEALYRAKQSGRNRFCFYTRSSEANLAGEVIDLERAHPPMVGATTAAIPASSNR